MPSLWETFDIESKIMRILDLQPYAEGHHFGRPFLTPYQIAIEFRNRHPDEFRQINMPLGGDGTGQNHSFAQYIAKELSQRINAHRLPDIEGRFLCRQNLTALRFKTEAEEFESSQNYDLSVFRRIR